MATCESIIHAAYRIAGVVIASGRVENTSQKNEGLEKLQSLMDTYRLPTQLWYEIAMNVHTLTPSLNPHTIGVGGNLNQERPVQIIEAYLRYIQSDPPVDTIIRSLTAQQYAQVPAKDVESPIPQFFWYTASYSSNTDPKGNLYLYMIPNQANEIVLYTPQVLTNPAALNTDLLLPPGYLRMLQYNLAVELVPLFPKRQNDGRADAVMYQMAKDAMYEVKINNIKPLDMQSDWATLNNQGGNFDWRTGDFRY